MNKSLLQKSEKFYNLFLKLYPKKFRSEFEEEMKFVFSQSIREEYDNKGERGLFRFWMRIGIDTLRSLYYQHIANLKEEVLMKNKNTDIFNQKKIFVILAAVTAGLLTIPLIAMKLGDDVNWTLFDFAVAGLLIFTTGLIFILIARRTKKHRLIAGIVLGVIFVYLWAELAVGIFTNWGS